MDLTCFKILSHTNRTVRIPTTNIGYPATILEFCNGNIVQTLFQHTAKLL